MITIPVLRNFDSTDVIGTMQIDETKLPERMNYVFALGYTVRDFNRDNIGDSSFDSGDLHCVSLLSDEQYVAYLNHRKERLNESTR